MGAEEAGLHANMESLLMRLIDTFRGIFMLSILNSSTMSVRSR